MATHPASEPSATYVPTTRPDSSLFLLKWLFGLISFVLKSGSELTRLTGEMHHTIAQAPLPFAKDVEADLQKAPRAYRLLGAVMGQGADRIHNWLEHIPDGDHLPVPLRRFRAGINGVMGDKLREWRHPLAQDMKWVDAEGHTLDLPALQASHPRGVVLFLHGLCLSEWDWQGDSNQRFVAELKEQGYGVAWLRYNSGLPIWENGAALARLLEEQWSPAAAGSLVLIGHSMGGLLIRSALHQAGDAGWLRAVTHAAYLASPHAGAPLERIGNFANSLLGVSPYSKPLMALGNIRSLGIRSLRHGNVTQPLDASENQVPLPLQEGVRHFLLAASLADDPSKRWIGDGLVPVQSALGESHFPVGQGQVERVYIDNMGHLKLLQDERTYAALRTWLQA